MMDTVLVLVTGVSLAIAIAMGVMVLTMLREDRRRSDARVAALLEMASTTSGTLHTSDVRRGDVQRAHVLRADVQCADVPRADVPRTDVPRTDVPRTDVQRAHVPRADVARAAVAREDVVRTNVAREHVARGQVAPDSGDLELWRPETTVAGVGELFAAPDRSSPWTSRFAVVAVLAVLVVGAGYVFVRSAAPAAPAVQATVAPAAPAPLELLSLNHRQQPDSITVSGLVQNPASGARVARVFASAFVFDEKGALLASGRAPLDFTALAPGDESPFVVTVPVTARVARYRIGFRTEDGSIIAHVDRRQSEAVAMK